MVGAEGDDCELRQVIVRKSVDDGLYAAIDGRDVFVPFHLVAAVEPRKP